MNYLIKVIIGCLLLISCGTTKGMNSNAIQKKKVFLFAGQSNMDGRANGAQLSEIDVERLTKVADRIQFYYNHQPVSPLRLTDASKYIQKKFQLTQCFGPELFFGIELAEKYPNEEFIFIKRAKGGTSLYGCWNPDWSAEKAEQMGELKQPKLYFDFIEYVENTLKEYDPKQYEIMGMLWVQGEADSGVKRWGEEPANSYGYNLQNLIEKVRAELKIPELPFVMFQVGSGKVVKGMIATSKNDDNVYLIPQSKNKNSTDFYERNPPPIGHYTAKSMKKIGIEFFKVYERILKDKTKANK